MSIVAGLFVLISTLAGANLVAGWASTMIVVLLLAGIQLITLGIVGEYVGKVYDEVRRRPTFIVAERYQQDTDTEPTAITSRGTRGFTE